MGLLVRFVDMLSAVQTVRSSQAVSMNIFRRAMAYKGWSHVEQAPPDPILGLSQAFAADDHPKKINLGVGAYRDDQGKPFVLKCVKTAVERTANQNHEYAGIAGVPALTVAAAKLAFGPESPVLQEKRNVTVQSISGTGALRVAGEYLNRFQPNTALYLPTPTWAKHIPLFKDAGLQVRNYRYYNPNTCGLDFEGMKSDIKEAPEGSIILYHACAHNPTGVDPTVEQWNELSQLTKERGHFAMFDCAYQGFASGDCERDVYAVRKFVEDGHLIGLAQSFAKNFGLYGERVGALTFLAEDEKQATVLRSQLNALIRPMYSNPPIFGARLVTEILEDAELKQQWLEEVNGMSGRIIRMREALVKGLKNAGSERNWDHITDQIGMFCFTGLTPEQVDTLRTQYHIYMTRNGRVSVAGINSGNVDYLAKAMHEVTQ